MHTKLYEIKGREIVSAVTLGAYDWTTGPYAPENGPRIVELNASGDPDRVIMRITRDTADACDAEALCQMSDGFFESVNYTAWREVPAK